VEVRDVHAEPDQVTGVLVNLSSKPVRSIQVRIDRSWLWTNERHPGEDNPGRSVVYTVPDEIAPGGRLPFTYRPDAPLPERRGRAVRDVRLGRQPRADRLRRVPGASPRPWTRQGREHGGPVPSRPYRGSGGED
jgi:hypothetical protein